MNNDNILLKSALALAIVDLVLIAAILLQVNNLVKDVLEVQNKQLEIEGMKEKLKKAEEARKQELETLKKKLEETKEPGVRVVEKIILQGVSDSEIKNWNHYEAQRLGFVFDYPKSFGEFSITISPAERGKIFYGKSQNGDIQIGGATQILDAGGGTVIFYTTGYKEDEKGNFYIKFPNSSSGALISPIKLISTKETQFVLIQSESSQGPDPMNFGKDNIIRIGAVVNSKNDEFPGFITVVNKNVVPQDLFEQILNTFKFID